VKNFVEIFTKLLRKFSIFVEKYMSRLLILQIFFEFLRISSNFFREKCHVAYLNGIPLVLYLLLESLLRSFPPDILCRPHADVCS